ncbi:MAG: hypothetical protein A2068_04545 [Ignavibacteria bacterium GWB2_35_6b]|nr:MAG: hypothetical protein A2068_04545 [Ignavibacteria bacterium GWB2_35_6b]
MKRILVHLIIVAVLFACNQTGKQVEVLYEDHGDYKTYADLKPHSEDKPSSILGDVYGNKGVRTKLLHTLTENKKYLELSISSPDETYDFLLLVNAQGGLDKIVVKKSMGEELDNIVINEVNKWKFEPAVINGKKEKFIFELQFDGTEYSVVVDEMPEPIGGIKAIADLVKYPDEAKKAGYEGRVYVKTFLNEFGIVDSVELIKGIGHGCDEAALNAVKQAKFKPGKDSGEPVKTQVVVPIMFMLK